MNRTAGRSDIASLLADGELDAAITEVRSSATASPDDRLLLAYLLQQRGDFPDSRDVMIDLLHDTDRSGEVALRHRIASAQWYGGDLRGAEATLSAIETERGSAADLTKLRQEIASLDAASAKQAQLERGTSAVVVVGIAVLAVAIWSAASTSRPRKKASEQ